jgi:hypothetical protein
MPRLCHAILYDADEKGRQALAYGFEVDGLKVTATADLEAARGLVTVTPGEVVIVVVRESDPAGIPLARRLAENPETRAVPRLVLAETATLPERLVGLPGPTAFLPLPAFVRDVVTATKLLAAGAASGEESSFEGALSDLGLFFIVRCMVGLGLSGIVELERGARKGELRFQQGEIVSAQVGGLEGPAALHQLLLWEEAALVMRFRETVRRGQAFTHGEELLDDCARFLRDFEHATRSIGHAQSLFVQDAEKTASLLDVVPQELVPVMRLFDGHRNLGDVLEDSPFRVFDTLRSVSRLIELGTIRRKAIEKPSTGLTGQHRKVKSEDWLGRSAELPALAVSATPATGVAPVHPASAHTTQPLQSPPAGGSAAAAARGRRSFRRKTGEHAIAPAPGPGQVPASLVTTNGAAPAFDHDAGIPATPAAPPAEAPPAPPAEPALPGLAAQAPGSPTLQAPPPAQIPTAPVPGPVVAAPAVAAALPPRKAKGGILAAHGELSGSGAGHAELRGEDVPKVLVELGPDLQPEAELASSDHLEDLPAAEPPPLPINVETRPASSPPESPVEMPPNPIPGLPPQPALQRPPGVQTAEIDTGMRPPPPPELLEAPSGGPSIMIDPGFSEEMDAFELAHSQPTPPPAVVAPPAVAASPTAESPADPVVSFVRGVSAARSALANTTFNAAPTIPISALPPAARPATHAPAPTEPTPPPAGADTEAPAAPVSLAPDSGGTEPPAPDQAASPARSERKERRASGEFDALESEFFAREAELYKKEAVENFDDLDQGKGKNPR